MVAISFYLLGSLFILPALSAPIVHLRDGDAEGIADETVGVWRGIPFAAPPVRDLRWRPPQPVAAWRPTTLNAKKFANDCIQPVDYGMNSTEKMNGTAEDCLYINVYAPLPLSEPLKPVFLWIYGGGFQGGGSSNYRLDGTPDVKLSQGKLILVTFNYRLNVFGFAASNLLRERDPEGGTGNYGILDQRFAMRWVRDNMRAFGGDPSRVTIIGESAGADSVANHLVRRKSWGLFSGAGAESGAFYVLGSHLHGDHSKPLGPTPGNVTVAQQERKFAALMMKAKCSNVDCLLQLSENDLLKIESVPEEMPWPWEPTIDGVDLVAAAPSLAARGELAPVPVLVGSNMEDASIAPSTWSCDPTSCSEKDFWRLAKDGWGFNETEAKRLVQLYSNEGQRPVALNNSKWYWAAKHAGADAMMTCSARRLARWSTQVGQRAFWYYWTYTPLSKPEASHACELPFVFQTSIEPSESEFSKKVASYWTGFVDSGTPHVPGLATWPPYSDATGSTLIFGDNMTTMAQYHFLQAKCDFWDRHFNEQWGVPSASESMIVV